MGEDIGVLSNHLLILSKLVNDGVLGREGLKLSDLASQVLDLNAIGLLLAGL